MKGPAYSVITTSHFDRLMKKLTSKHPGLTERFEEAISILSGDPYNRSCRYAIRKLENVPAGEANTDCAPVTGSTTTTPA